MFVGAFARHILTNTSNSPDSKINASFTAAVKISSLHRYSSTYLIDPCTGQHAILGFIENNLNKTFIFHSILNTVQTLKHVDGCVVRSTDQVKLTPAVHTSARKRCLQNRFCPLF